MKRSMSPFCWCAAFLFCLLTPTLANTGADSGIPTESTTASAAIVVDKDYKIAEEDVLRMDVWGEQQLSNMQMQVTPDGKINVPYIGSMQAVGFTQDAVAKSIADALAAKGFIYDANIQITLISMHQPTVRVLGEVNRAGTVIYKDGDSILDAIAQAGSYTENAMLEKATLTHKDSKTQETIDLRNMFRHGDLAQNYKLQKGDTIYVPPEDYNNKAYVLGQVNRPGIISLKENTTLLTAISIAGGATPNGVLKRTVVIRGDPKKPERVECNLNKLFEKADLSQDIVLRPGDVVLVPERKGIDWNKIGSILGAIVNVGYVRRMGLF